MNLIEKFSNSAKELNKVQSLATLGMLLAMRVVVGIFSNSTMALFGNMVKIGINFLPIAVAACIFGPVGAALVGGLGDVLSYLLNPMGGAYFPGFTLNGILTGIIIGIFLYKNNNSLGKIIVSWTINAVLIEILLSGVWLFYIYGAGGGKTFMPFLLTRLISEAIKFVPTVAIIFFTLKGTERIKLK